VAGGGVGPNTRLSDVGAVGGQNSGARPAAAPKPPAARGNTTSYLPPSKRPPAPLRVNRTNEGFYSKFLGKEI
jgi:hypothetical protein